MTEETMPLLGEDPDDPHAPDLATADPVPEESNGDAPDPEGDD